MRHGRRATRLATWVLLATGLIALGYAAYVVADAYTYQATERKRFEQATNDAAVVPASNAVTALLEGEVIGEIQIRRLGLTAVVAQGESAATLQRAVGHLSDTALPGELGNVVLAGHRDTFFRPLKGVRPGDAITLKTQEGDFEYLVESSAVVRPSNIEVLEPIGRTHPDADHLLPVLLRRLSARPLHRTRASARARALRRGAAFRAFISEQAESRSRSTCEIRKQLVCYGSEEHMITILLVLAVLMLLGAIPAWSHSRSWGYGPSGGLGLVVLILVILLLTGRI